MKAGDVSQGQNQGINNGGSQSQGIGNGDGQNQGISNGDGQNQGINNGDVPNQGTPKQENRRSKRSTTSPSSKVLTIFLVVLDSFPHPVFWLVLLFAAHSLHQTQINLQNGYLLDGQLRWKLEWVAYAMVPLTRYRYQNSLNYADNMLFKNFHFVVVSYANKYSNFGIPTISKVKSAIAVCTLEKLVYFNFLKKFWMLFYCVM